MTWSRKLATSTMVSSSPMVLVTPRCADPLYRRSVRVSMGTVFQVPWTRVDPWPAGVDVLRDVMPASWGTHGTVFLDPQSIRLDIAVLGFTLVVAESHESGDEESTALERLIPIIDGAILAVSRLDDQALREVAGTFDVLHPPGEGLQRLGRPPDRQVAE